MKKKKRFTVVLIAVLAFAALCITACASKKNNAAAVPESFSVSRSTEAYIDEFNIADYSVSVRYSDGTEKTYSLADYIAQADLDLLATLGSHDITVNLGGYSATITFTIKNHAFDGVTFPSGTVEYDGKSHSLAVAGLPAGANVTYANNGKTEPGTYNVTATLTRENYAPKTLNATLVIEKRELAVNITGETLIKYDGEEHKNYKVTATNLVDSNDKVDLTLSFSGNMKDAGTYTVTASLAEHEHYKLTGNNTLTVTITREIHTVTFRQSGQPDRTVEVADLGAVAEEDIPRPVQEAGYTVTWNADALAGLSSVTDDIVVEATKTPIQYNITYEVGEGTNNPDNPATYTIEQAFDLKAPTREHYDFDGWHKGSINGARVERLENDYGELKLYAKWTAHVYTVKYENLQGGTNPAANRMTYTVEDGSFTLSDPTRDHYDFKGWYTEPGFENKVETIGNGTYKDYTLYAQWEAHKYRITYEVGEGTNNPGNPETYTVEDQLFTLLEPTPKRGSFGGWYTADNAGGVRKTTIGGGETGDITLYAHWLEYYITAADGFTIDGNKLYIDVHNTVANLDLQDKIHVSAHCTWKLYKDFEGNSELTLKAISLNYGHNEAYVIVYSDESEYFTRYTLDIYRLSMCEYKFTDRGTNKSSGTLEERSTVDKIADPAARTGYEFAGWAVKGSSAIVEFPYTVNKNVEFVAQWIANTYTVHLNADGGDGLDEADRTMTYGSAYEFPVLTRTGYTFLGWFAGDDKLTEPNGKSTEPWTFDEDNMQITAKWQINKYNLTVETNNSDVGTVTGGGNFDYGTEVTITATAPTALGYIFSGWYKDGAMVSQTLEYTFAIAAANETYIAQYNIAPEMSNFVFTSDLTTCKITGIKDNTVQDIVVPDYVTSIAEGAFSGCGNLISITIPFVGDTPNTPNDKNQYPFGYIFGWSSYSGGTKTRQDYYGSSTSSTTYDYYYIPTSLTTVTITGSSYILCGAFYKCSNLTSITIPASVTSIGEEAFYNCSSLTAITIPTSVTSIGGSAFIGCTDLQTVTFAGDSKLESIGSYAFASCSNLQTVTFADDSQLESIDSYAFQYCRSLTEITIPASVTSIGGYAFRGCTNLQTVNWNATNCTKVGAYNSASRNSTIFQGCTSLTTVNIGANVQTIPSWAFYGCSSLTEITIPASVTSIGGGAFSGCTSLNTVTFAGDSKLKSIGSSAFANCSELTEITIPASVTLIYEGAFSGCSSLVSIILPFVGDKPHTAEDTYQYPFGYIFGESEFSGGTKTRQDYYGSSTSSTTYDYYYIPTSLTTVTITGSSYIPYGAFDNCGYLTEITIPASVTSIGGSAFYNCGSLTKVYYSSTLVDWCDMAFGNASANPLNNGADLYINDELQEEITIPQEITAIKACTFAGCNATSVTIHEGVTSIGSYAFYGCSNLTEIAIPASVTAIGNYAFAYCTNLQTVNWNATNCTKAGSYSSSYDYTIFKGCTALTTVNIGENVESIPTYAFFGCSKLTSITIPASVISIGGSAFYNCSSLTEVYYSSTLVDWCNMDFGNVYANPLNNGADLYIDGEKQTMITIPQEITEIKACTFAGCNATSVTIHADITSIGNYAFYGCSNFTEITISKGVTSVTSIGNYAFYGCSGLTSITIPINVTSIGNYAFSKCSGLTEITILQGVDSIGYRAFYGCNNLQKAIFYSRWKVSKNSDMSYSNKLVDKEVMNGTTAAEYLRSTYCDYYWQRYF